NTTIGRTSLVACNLESNNLTDNPDSQYGKQVIQRLHQGGINGDLSVRSSYVGIQPDGTKVTSNTGVDNWKHKDSEAKTVYSYDKNGKVESKVYDGNGVLVKYNGQHLDGTRYKSNVIVQNSDNATVAEAANALFNKHPNTSVIVKFDQNGNLVTLKGEAYTPTGDIRVNFVDHGVNLTQEGAQSLADKARILQQTYGNSNTKIKRMALVGCDTDGVDQALTRNFANAVYNDMPALKQTEITGRTGQVQVNDNGTKTMTTGGAKTIYSWDNDGRGIAQKTETVKRYSDSLENPLGKFDDQIKEIDALLKITPMSESTKKILTDTRNAFSDINYIYQTAPSSVEHIMGLMEKHKLELKAYLDEHKDTQVKESLEAFRDSLNAQCADLQFEIETRLNEEFSNILKEKSENQVLKLIAFHEKLPSKTNQHSQLAWLTYQSLEKMKRAASNTLSKMEDRVSTLDALSGEEKIRVLAEVSKHINDLYENLEYFKEAVQTKIKEFKTKTLPLLELSTWDKEKVVDVYRVPLVDDNAFRVVVQLSNNIAYGASTLASKHFGNSTLIHMDEYGNYRVVYGSELESIPDGTEVKFEILSHSNAVKKTMGKRTAADMAKSILDLKAHIPKTVDVTAVSLKGCSAGADYGKDVLIEFNKKNFKPVVSSKLSTTEMHPFGRTFTSRVYHSEDNRTAWKYDENDKIVAVPYSDEKHHIVLFIDEEGNPKVIKTHDNKDWKKFKGELRVKVVAENFPSAPDALKDFQAQLKTQGAKMSQIDIETGGKDWFKGRPNNTLRTYGNITRLMSGFIESNITLRVDSGPYSGTTIFGYKDAPHREIVVHGPEYVVSYSDEWKNNYIAFDYNRYNIPLFCMPIKSYADVVPYIYIAESHTKEMVLSQLQKAKKEAGESSILKVVVITDPRYLIPEQESKDLVDYLSQKLGVRIERFHKDADSSKPRLLLSKNPGDSEAQVHGHLAETTLHQDTPLHNWDALSQDQINKLDTESQKPKPSLANHDHQVLIQTEADDNVKDNTLRLASKHPTQTTIVQMQKDGTYKVVYGAKLENITGRVKMVAVGYGREKNGVQTLGGRNESELSDNILTLKRDLNPTNTTIGRI
ncbi:C80 family cysteine peptidase, partial [Bathymodiolus thermophilus thioautotrophic gill symbiont]|uniref:C80 family cysteine peptidase n=1 Tax=Bathymodiolus thermophilus thioautotrophic gill symbiont TaxID=2360 RepID=UPI001116A8F2